VDSLNYAEVMKFAIVERLSKPALGTAGLYMVNVFLTLTQFGFCAVYFVFIGDSLSCVVKQAFSYQLTTDQAIAIVLPLIVVCCWIRELEGLTTFSLIANICIVFSLAVIFYEMVYQLSHREGAERAAIWDKSRMLHPVNFKQFPLYFGSAVYAFEGIGMVLPLENKMRKPHHFQQIIILGMIVIVSIYILFGLLGYLVYGDDICPSITLNLTSTRIAAKTVFIIAVLYYGYAIFASFMLQFYVPMDFLEVPFFKLIRMERVIDYLFYSRPHWHGPVKWTLHTLFRTTLVLVTAAFAFAIPDLDGLITLIGAVASAALAFIFPPLLQLLTFWEDKPPFLTFHLNNTCLAVSWWVTVAKCLAILLLGLVGSLTGTVFSIISIVQYFKDKNDLCSC
jgi:proton-coupled amino acid transporter